MKPSDQLLVELLPETRGESNITVGHNRDRSVASNDLATVHVGQLLGQRALLYGQEMGTLGQSIHYDPYSIKSLRGPWQFGDEIHSDMFPFPHGNL